MSEFASFIKSLVEKRGDEQNHPDIRLCLSHLLFFVMGMIVMFYILMGIDVFLRFW